MESFEKCAFRCLGRRRGGQDDLGGAACQSPWRGFPGVSSKRFQKPEWQELGDICPGAWGLPRAGVGNGISGVPSPQGSVGTQLGLVGIL